MKTAATGLLVAVAIIFVIARVIEQNHHWVGYIRATAEAAMVGALADWFAVTALFKHPLNLPIPHTAIIQKRKDQIGESLGEFVKDNFLTSEVVGDRLEDADLALRLGEWLEDPDHAKNVGEQSAAIVRGLTEVLQDDMVQGGIDQVVTKRVQAIPVAPLAGRIVDVAIEGQHHQVLIDSTLVGLAKFLNENRGPFRKRLNQESPWWVPEQVDDRIFEKIYDALNRFVDDVGVDRTHELRVQLDVRTRELAERLKSSPELLVRGEELKAELLAHPEVRAWVASLWDRIKVALIEATEDPNSDLRKQLDSALADAGRSLRTDPAMRAKVDRWIVDGTSYIAEQFRGEVAGLIATTVQSWDTQETADRLELQVGRDLQFIRINGTIVGGLAGLVIYTVSEFLL